MIVKGEPKLYAKGEMALPRTIRTILIFVPLLLFLLVLSLPYSSARLSLLAKGFPFAHVVAKDSLNIFQYVHTDGFANRAVVFSNGKAVGLIVEPLGAFAYFEPFALHANSGDTAIHDSWLNSLLLVTWSLRWFLLPIQAILVLLWLRRRNRNNPHSVALPHALNPIRKQP